MGRSAPRKRADIRGKLLPDLFNNSHPRKSLRFWANMLRESSRLLKLNKYRPLGSLSCTSRSPEPCRPSQGGDAGSNICFR